MTVVGLFREPREAEIAVQALRDAEFNSVQVGVAPAGAARVPRYGVNAFVGTMAGTALGGVLGLVVGVALTGVLPGMHVWLTGGWLAVIMLVVALAATGTVAGLLISQSFTRQGVLYYEEEVSAGRTLVSVDVEPQEAERARRILSEHGAFDAAPLDTPKLKAS